MPGSNAQWMGTPRAMPGGGEPARGEHAVPGTVFRFNGPVPDTFHQDRARRGQLLRARQSSDVMT